MKPTVAMVQRQNLSGICANFLRRSLFDILHSPLESHLVPDIVRTALEVPTWCIPLLIF